jgi:hypothetical protein
MNAQERAKEQAEVMLAWANGAEIEVTYGEDCGWEHTKSPGWNWFVYDYRVKVVPKVVKYYCYADGYRLLWVSENSAISGDWIAVPSEDKEVTL